MKSQGRPERPAPGARALRAEHDRLAERLASRRSIDLVRGGAYSGFIGLIGAGLAAKLAFDRWWSQSARRFTGPPVWFLLALAAAAVLLTLAVVLLVRARRLMRGEDADFARLRALRRELGLDA